MKRSFWLKAGLSVGLSALYVSPAAFALTTEAAKARYTWSTFQGGPSHTGYIPITLDVLGTETIPTGWEPPLFAISLTGGHPLMGVSVIEGDPGFIYPRLNQPTIVENDIFLTNRGLGEPHQMMHVDPDTGEAIVFEYNGSGAELGYFDDGTDWTDTFCPVSQSQITVLDTVLYYHTNFTEHADEDSVCSLSTATSVQPYLRAQPYIPNKNPDGTSTPYLVLGESTRIQLEGHVFDEFLAPTIFDEIAYTPGGGNPTLQSNTGIYAFKDTNTNLEEVTLTDQWSSDPTTLGLTKLSPNNLWAPAVNNNYVITFTNGYIENSYEDDIGELNVINRLTGAIVFTIPVTEFAFAPENSAQPFHMENAPVLANENNVLVINNDHLVRFNLGTRNIEWAIERGFYGQPSVADVENVIYAASDDATECDSNPSCIIALNLNSAAPILDSAGDSWSWAPSDGSTIIPPFVVTKSHVFVSTDSNKTFAVSRDATLANGDAARESWQYDVGGKLAFAYNTLYIAHYEEDMVVASGQAIGRRRRVDLPTYATLASAFDTDFLANISQASTLLAIPFQVSVSDSADLSVAVTPITASNTTIALENILTYTISVTNNGALTTAAPMLIGEVPFAFEITELPDGCTVASQQLSCNLTAHTPDGYLDVGETISGLIIRGEPTAVGNLIFDFTVDSELLDSDESDNSQTVLVRAVAAAPTTHNAGISFAAGTAEVNLNNSITYTANITNAGPDLTTDVIATFVVSNNQTLTQLSMDSSLGTCTLNTATCEIDSLANGQSIPITIRTTAIATGAATVAGSITVSRTSATDSNTNNNSVTSGITNVSQAISASGEEDLPSAGGSLSFYWNLIGLILIILTRRASLK
ncbi:MAG: hypothetical protein V4629_03645 [Pseudomonadota bacterium]